MREKIDLRLQQSLRKRQLTPIAIDDDIGELVAGALPSSAVQSSQTGEAARLRSLDGLAQRSERLVEPQARALRPRAQQLCNQVEVLDALDNALAYRLPSDASLQLLQVDPCTSK